MKKAILLLLILALGSFVWFGFKKRSQPETLSTHDVSRSTVTIAPKKAFSKSLFVPYWTLGDTNEFKDYDTVIYFGIAPTMSGIDTQDEGYLGLATYAASVDSEQKSLLTVRMIDQDINAEVIKNSQAQEAIVLQTLEIAKAHDFDGIVLDLEYSALGFESIEKRITAFTRLFSEKAKNENKEFYMTLYGDVYYRARPYNVKELGHYVDGMYIMAYDFHKARGNPGPNFPLSGKEKYGYDLVTLIAELNKDLPSEKVIPVLGFFGYDWKVDSDEKALGVGRPLSANKILQDTVNNCVFEKCEYERDTESAETKVKYSTEGENHIIWFEDLESAQRKQDVLSQKNITHFGYWAYTFF